MHQIGFEGQMMKFVISKFQGILDTFQELDLRIYFRSHMQEQQLLLIVTRDLSKQATFRIYLKIQSIYPIFNK